jgi:hypothetical protein
MKQSGLLLLALLACLPVTGCVTRRVLITSSPSGAMVYRNGQPIGTTPVEEEFTYYGKYHYRLVRDGCEPADFFPDLVAPWYQRPGVDFVTENLIPFQFQDRPALHFQLQPARPMRHDDIRGRASQLQEMSKGIQPPPDAEPPTRPNRGGRAAPAIPGAPVISGAPTQSPP